MSHDRPLLGPDLDLVEYLLVVVPEVGSLEQLTPAVADIVAAAEIRILDLVVVERSATDGALTVVEIEDIDSMRAMLHVVGEVGGLLSEHDIATAAVALEAGSSAMLILVEDRWAANLSMAAKQAGGRVVGGERITRHRLEIVLNSMGGGDGYGSPHRPDSGR